MSAQVGIPKYKDLLNNIEIVKLKELIDTICIDYSKLVSKEAVDNRESDKYETYIKQFSVDIIHLKDMVDGAQKLVNKINEDLFMISTRSVNNRLYNG